MTQREGRILRQGNENSKVYIYRYITEGSFDAYSWQLLETKQRFISGLLSGSLMERSGTEIDNTVLDYAEVKALAVGDPLIKERVETTELSFQQHPLPFLNSPASFSVFMGVPPSTETQLISCNICVQNVFHHAQACKHSRCCSNLSRKLLERLCFCSL